MKKLYINKYGKLRFTNDKFRDDVAKILGITRKELNYLVPLINREEINNFQNTFKTLDKLKSSQKIYYVKNKKNKQSNFLFLDTDVKKLNLPPLKRYLEGDYMELRQLFKNLYSYEGSIKEVIEGSKGGIFSKAKIPTVIITGSLSKNVKALETIKKYYKLNFITEVELSSLEKKVNEPEQKAESTKKTTKTEEKLSSSNKELNQAKEVIKESKTIVQKFKKIRTADDNIDKLVAFGTEISDYLIEYNKLSPAIKKQYEKIAVNCAKMLAYIDNQKTKATQEN